ncbi:hypothetical protein PSK29_06365 [Escherichia coli]|nr:hypothetical protein [Escherichia coli]
MSNFEIIAVILFFLLYLIGLLFVPIDLNITTKIINATGAFSLFLLIVNKKAQL